MPDLLQDGTRTVTDIDETAGGETATGGGETADDISIALGTSNEKAS